MPSAHRLPAHLQRAREPRADAARARPGPRRGDRVLVIDDNSPDGTGRARRPARRRARLRRRPPPRAEGRPRPGVPRRLPARARRRRRARARDGLRLLARPERRAAPDRGGRGRRRPRARLALRPRRRRSENWGLAAALHLARAARSTRGSSSACRIRDLTGGFKCFRRARARDDRPRRDPLEGLRVPDRDDLPRAAQGLPGASRCRSASSTARSGGSKMSRAIVLEAIWKVPLLRLARPRQAGCS